MSGAENVDLIEEMIKSLDWQKSSEIGYWYKKIGDITLNANSKEEAWKKELSLS